MSAPWDYSIHFTKDFHTNLLKKLGKTCQFCKLLRCHKTQMWKRVLNWKRKPWRRMYGVNWMVGNSIPRSVQTSPALLWPGLGQYLFLGCLKIFWAGSIFFWADSRYFCTGSRCFGLAQEILGAGSREFWGWHKGFLGLAQDFLGRLKSFLGLAQDIFGWNNTFWGWLKIFLRWLKIF